MLDVALPGLSGLDLQGRIAGERADMPIIFITGHGDIPITVQAMKSGAAEFLTKPFTDEVLLNAVRQALERSRIAPDQAALQTYGTVTTPLAPANGKSWLWWSADYWVSRWVASLASARSP